MFQALDAHQRRYIPTPADAGCMLHVECTPAAESAAGTSDSHSSAGSGALGSTSSSVAAGGRQLRLGDSEVLTIGPVEAGPGDATPTARRHALTGQSRCIPSCHVTALACCTCVLVMATDAACLSADMSLSSAYINTHL